MITLDGPRSINWSKSLLDSRTGGRNQNPPDGRKLHTNHSATSVDRGTALESEVQRGSTIQTF